MRAKIRNRTSKIPNEEKWLIENKKTLNQVKRGLEDSAAERVKNRGSFAKYTDEDTK